MENKLDKLFRDKLEQHSIIPSALAWEKVAPASRPLTPNGGTSTAHVVWAWRIAAAVTLLAVAGWYAFDFGKNATQEISKNTNIEKPKQEVVTKEKTAIEIRGSEKKTSSPVQRVAPKPIIMQEPTPQLTVAQLEKGNVIENIQPEQTIASVEEVIEPVAIPEPVVQKAKPMVIVFNLAPVESKQEVETAKANAFKKVIEFAKDVKGGETTTLASVRNWKDNLFGSEEQTRVEKHHNN